MAFSNQARMAIEGFAATLGLPATPSPDGSYSFVFQQSGTLGLTSSDDGTRTLVSLHVRPHRLDEEIEGRLMTLAGPDITTGRFLSAGVTRDGGVLFSVSVGDPDISLPMLDACLQQLLAARVAVN